MDSDEESMQFYSEADPHPTQPTDDDDDDESIAFHTEGSFVSQAHAMGMSAPPQLPPVAKFTPKTPSDVHALQDVTPATELSPAVGQTDNNARNSNNNDDEGASGAVHLAVKQQPARDRSTSAASGANSDNAGTQMTKKKTMVGHIMQERKESIARLQPTASNAARRSPSLGPTATGPALPPPQPPVHQQNTRPSPTAEAAANRSPTRVQHSQGAHHQAHDEDDHHEGSSGRSGTESPQPSMEQQHQKPQSANAGPSSLATVNYHLGHKHNNMTEAQAHQMIRYLTEFVQPPEGEGTPRNSVAPSFREEPTAVVHTASNRQLPPRMPVLPVHQVTQQKQQQQQQQRQHSATNSNSIQHHRMSSHGSTQAPKQRSGEMQGRNQEQHRNDFEQDPYAAIPVADSQSAGTGSQQALDQSGGQQHGSEAQLSGATGHGADWYRAFNAKQKKDLAALELKLHNERLQLQHDREAASSIARQERNREEHSKSRLPGTTLISAKVQHLDPSKKRYATAALTEQQHHAIQQQEQQERSGNQQRKGPTTSSYANNPRNPPQREAGRMDVQDQQPDQRQIKRSRDQELHEAHASAMRDLYEDTIRRTAHRYGVLLPESALVTSEYQLADGMLPFTLPKPAFFVTGVQLTEAQHTELIEAVLGALADGAGSSQPQQQEHLLQEYSGHKPIVLGARKPYSQREPNFASGFTPDRHSQQQQSVVRLEIHCNANGDDGPESTTWRPFRPTMHRPGVKTTASPSKKRIGIDHSFSPKPKSRTAILRAIYTTLDVDRKGFITRDHLQQVAASLLADGNDNNEASDTTGIATVTVESMQQLILRGNKTDEDRRRTSRQSEKGKLQYTSAPTRQELELQGRFVVECVVPVLLASPFLEFDFSTFSQLLLAAANGTYPMGKAVSSGNGRQAMGDPFSSPPFRNASTATATPIKPGGGAAAAALNSTAVVAADVKWFLGELALA